MAGRPRCVHRGLNERTADDRDRADGDGFIESRGAFEVLALVEFVVERFQADAEFFGGLGFVAAVAFQRLVDGLHFQVAQRDGAELAVRPLPGRSIADVRGGGEMTHCRCAGGGGEVVGQVLDGRSAVRRTGSTACSITLASSRTLPGQS